MNLRKSEIIHSNNDQTEEIGKQAALLSLIEIGLGSFLHSFKIPLTGQILSINQIAMLSRTAFKLNSLRPPLQISLISSILKSLSPAGKKLTPMLAIAAQGLLYYIGMLPFGVNYLGLFFAILLSSLWAFIQPVLFIYFLFGKNSIEVAQYFLKEFEKIISNADQIIFRILFVVVILKWLLTLIISLIAIHISESTFNKYQKKMLLKISRSPEPAQSAKHQNAYMAFRDLLNPLFLISFLMTIFFFVFSQSQLVTLNVWTLFRPLALGFALFYIIRVYPVENLSAHIQKKGFTQLSKVLDAAIRYIKESRGL